MDRQGRLRDGQTERPQENELKSLLGPWREEDKKRRRKKELGVKETIETKVRGEETMKDSSGGLFKE